MFHNILREVGAKRKVFESHTSTLKGERPSSSAIMWNQVTFCRLTLMAMNFWVMVAMVMIIMWTVTLPTPPWSLRHSAANESAPLSEFQQELVTLASSLKNRFNMPPTPNRATAQPHHFTIGEANFFIKDAVSSFMQKGMQQLQAGMDPATEVRV